MSKRSTDDELIEAAWWSGVKAVQGRVSVEQALKQHPMPEATDHHGTARPVAVLAIGKAAASMAEGAIDAGITLAPSLVITKYHHSLSRVSEHPQFTTLESAHPVPDEASLVAGEAAIEFVRNTQGPLLLLVSGGASALCEAPAKGWDLHAIQARTQALLGEGASIATINAERAAMSRVKGGQLLSHYAGTQVSVMAISDVEQDDIRVIGSGIGAAPPDSQDRNTALNYQCQLVGSNAIARAAAERSLRQVGLEIVENKACLFDDVTALSYQLSRRLQTGPAGAYIWGGEPTVTLPERPGEGGRNQSLALALDLQLSGLRVQGLVAGTDGSDGPTTAAGGWFSGDTLALEDKIEAEKALARANAGPELSQRGQRFSTGPTGTNVMDVVIVIKR